MPHAIFRYNGQPEEQDPYEKGWQTLILAADAGVKLSPEDERALQTREAVLKIADYYSAVGEGEVNTKDVVAHATALAPYYEGLDTIRRLGIQPNAQAGRPDEDYYIPAVIAERAAGQWLMSIEKPAIPLHEVRRQIEEITEQKASMGDSEMRLLSGADLTPKVRDWMVMRSMVNVTDRFLAGQLGRPEVAEVPEPSEKQE